MDVIRRQDGTRHGTKIPANDRAAGEQPSIVGMPHVLPPVVAEDGTLPRTGRANSEPAVRPNAEKGSWRFDLPLPLTVDKQVASCNPEEARREDPSVADMAVVVVAALVPVFQASDGRRVAEVDLMAVVEGDKGTMERRIPWLQELRPFRWVVAS